MNYKKTKNYLKFIEMKDRLFATRKAIPQKIEEIDKEIKRYESEIEKHDQIRAEGSVEGNLDKVSRAFDESTKLKTKIELAEQSKELVRQHAIDSLQLQGKAALEFFKTNVEPKEIDQMLDPFVKKGKELMDEIAELTIKHDELVSEINSSYQSVQNVSNVRDITQSQLYFLKGQLRKYLNESLDKARKNK